MENHEFLFDFFTPIDEYIKVAGIDAGIERMNEMQRNAEEEESKLFAGSVSVLLLSLKEKGHLRIPVEFILALASDSDLLDEKKALAV